MPFDEWSNSHFGHYIQMHNSVIQIVDF
jgi:hypothetical protein